MLLGQRIQIPIVPGVNPIEDSTALDTMLFTDADKVRFQQGKLRKIKGWQRIFPVDGLPLTGYIRNIYSYRDANNNPVTVFGTNTRLYAYIPTTGDYFYNITPLQTTTNIIAAAFSTEYNSSVTVSVVTTNGSPVVTLNINNYFENNDNILISGVTGGPYHGIPAASFNGTFPVYAVGNTAIEITLPSNATSSGAVNVTMTWAATYLYVNVVGSGVELGDRVKILASSSVGGISAASINKEHIVTQVVDDDNFIIDTGTFATSSVSGGGGNSTTIQYQIPAGNATQNGGDGFGSAQFGQGTYGISTPNGGVSYPRIWSMDAYGTTLILTPGDGAPSTANLYSWANDPTVAPTILSGAPDNVIWTYVSNNIVVTLGSGGVLNSFTASDTANSNQWTPGPTTYAYTTNILQASALISQARTREYDVLFTQADVYRVNFIDKPDIWFFQQLFATDGIIGPKARAVIQDSVFWMGQGDFYVFDGNTVNAIPNNTLKRYVFDNVNTGQSYKCFAYANVEWSEVWFFFPFGQDSEPNDYVIYNYKEQHWTNGTLSRTASEELVNVNALPVLAQSGVIQSISLANGINTYYFSMPTDPFTTTNMSAVVAVLTTALFIPNIYLEVGDIINISGSTGVGGIPAIYINQPQTLTYVSINPSTGDVALRFTVGQAATSGATGGGSAVKMGTPFLGITWTGAANLGIGDTITIADSSAIGGFTVAVINQPQTVTYIKGTFIRLTISTPSTFSTSAVTGGGGLSAVLLLPAQAYIFEHETGLNDYNVNFDVYTDPWENQFAPMNSYAITNYFQIQEGDNTMLIYSMYPDISMQQNMTVTVNVKEFAQSGDINTQTFNLTPTTTKIDPMMIGRVRQYKWTSNIINGNFLMGHMNEELIPSTPR